MSSDSRRNVLRIPTEVSGRLLVRDEMRVFDRPVPVQIQIVNATPDGLGMELRGRIPRLAPDTAVVVELQINTVKLSIPGKLVWFEASENTPTTAAGVRVQDPIAAGVRLQLQIADSRTREAFIGWVVQNARTNGLLEAFQRSVLGG